MKSDGEFEILADQETLSAAEKTEFDSLIRTLENLNASEARRATNTPIGDIRSASFGELRDQALKVLETEGRYLGPDQLDRVDRLVRTRNGDVDGASIARRILTTETEAYRSAFQKATCEAVPVFTPEESAAVAEFRAANEGTGSAGGFGVPVLIDPSIILTSGASNAPIVALARTVTITTDEWKGVSSAGVTWSYDAEGAAVSDDTPTFDQPSIPVYAARGFIPYSIEVGQDYPGFADEMSMLLNQGYIDLLAKQSATGSGSSAPLGVFTGMASVTTNPAHVVVATPGALGAVDVRKAWAALPERFRSRATWLMSTGMENQVHAFGNGNSISDYTVNLQADGTGVLTGRPVVTTDYAPDFTGVTTTANLAIVGDFSSYVFVNRAGMTVELVQHMFDTSSGRPTGERGWFAIARHGAGIANPNGLRLLSNN